MMDAATIEALAALLWPLILLVLLIAMYRPFAAMLGNIANRGGSIKIGEFELSLPEVAQQQQALISDLQAQVAELSALAQAAAPAGKAAALAAEPVRQAPGKRVLWVDDHPENNGSLQAALSEQGFSIANALSTDEAVRMFTAGAFDFVVSDMVRGMDRDAGATLARLLRKIAPAQKIAIYCGTANAARLSGQEARLGIDLITASPVRLLSFLNGAERSPE